MFTVQPHKMARGLTFRNWEEARVYYHVSKTKALISCAVTKQLICAFVFAYVKSRFFHDALNFHAHVLCLVSGPGNDGTALVQSYWSIVILSALIGYI